MSALCEPIPELQLSPLSTEFCYLVNGMTRKKIHEMLTFNILGTLETYLVMSRSSAYTQTDTDLSDPVWLVRSSLTLSYHLLFNLLTHQLGWMSLAGRNAFGLIWAPTLLL